MGQSKTGPRRVRWCCLLITSRTPTTAAMGIPLAICQSGDASLSWPWPARNDAVTQAKPLGLWELRRSRRRGRQIIAMDSIGIRRRGGRRRIIAMDSSRCLAAPIRGVIAVSAARGGRIDGPSIGGASVISGWWSADTDSETITEIPADIRLGPGLGRSGKKAREDRDACDERRDHEGFSRNNPERHWPPLHMIKNFPYQHVQPPTVPQFCSIERINTRHEGACSKEGRALPSDA